MPLGEVQWAGWRMLWMKRSLRPPKRRLPLGLLRKVTWHRRPPMRVELVVRCRCGECRRRVVWKEGERYERAW